MSHWNVARRLIVISAMVLLAGCTAILTRQPTISGGQLRGKLSLAWDDGYRFVAYPVEGSELTYTLPKGHRLAGLLGEIKPQLMFTDGGSIPRSFWSFDGLSPWEYGPAFIIHDWMFNQHYCKKEAYPVSLDEANDILLDSMILLDMQVAERHGRRPHNKEEVRVLIDAAVNKFSQRAWNNGACPATPKQVLKVTFESRTLRQVVTIAGRSRTILRTERIRKVVPRYRNLFVLSAD